MLFALQRKRLIAGRLQTTGPEILSSLVYPAHSLPQVHYSTGSCCFLFTSNKNVSLIVQFKDSFVNHRLLWMISFVTGITNRLPYTSNFNCHLPHPRVISMYELLSEDETAYKAFFPDTAVLHRCINAIGCCPPDHFSRPKQTRIVKLPFKVTLLKHTRNYKKGTWFMDYYNFVNHTECPCHFNDLIKYDIDIRR